MANYKEQTIAGTSYVRAKEVHINNPLIGSKHISFTEEQVVNLANGTSIVTPSTSMFTLSEVFTQDNAMTEFPLLDIYGEPTGVTTNYISVYLALQSLYYYLAQQRDAAAAAATTTEGQPV